MIAGERNPLVLSKLVPGTGRGKKPVAAQALTGRHGPHHAFLAHAILDRIDVCQEIDRQLSQQNDAQIRPFRRQLELIATIPDASNLAAEVIPR